jgi:hypothetical protein
MANDVVMNTIHEEANKFGFGLSVERLVGKIYFALHTKGFDVCILNDRYLICNGKNYQLLKSRSKGHWTVKEF